MYPLFRNPVPNSVSLYIFDLDGTLIDSVDDLALALNEILRRRGFPPVDRETVRRAVGRGAKNLVSKVFEASSGRAFDDAYIENALSEYRAIYRKNGIIHTRAYPGMVDWLDTLAEAGKTLAVLTNKPEAESREILGALGLAERFLVIAGPETFGATKPDPVGIFGILRAAGLSEPPVAFAPSGVAAPAGAAAPAGIPVAVMVGDADVDVLTARNAGIPCLALTGGIGDEHALRSAGPDWIIERTQNRQ